MSQTDTESPALAVVLTKVWNHADEIPAAMTSTCYCARACSNGLGTRKLRSECRLRWAWQSFRVERTKRISRKDRNRSARSFSICYDTILPRTCRIVFLTPGLADTSEIVPS